MTDSPFVSVIIPVYNGANYLHEAVDSVLGQTFTDYEIIIIDDGSKDNTWDIIQSYIDTHNDIIRGFHKENGGVTSAVNLGISVMKGTWFAWLSHDDLWTQTYLEKQVENISKHPDCPVAYTGFMTVDAQRNLIGIHTPLWYKRGKALRSMIVFGEHMTTIGMLIDCKCFDEIGIFNTKWRYVQDTDMIFKLIKNYDTCCIYEPLVKMRIHGNQVGSTANTVFKNEQKQLFIEWDENNTLNDYYPKLEDYSWFNRKMTKFFGTIYYKKFIPFCHRHNIPPTFRHLVWKMIPATLKMKSLSLYRRIMGKINYKSQN